MFGSSDTEALVKKSFPNESSNLSSEAEEISQLGKRKRSGDVSTTGIAGDRTSNGIVRGGQSIKRAVPAPDEPRSEVDVAVKSSDQGDISEDENPLDDPLNQPRPMRKLQSNMRLSDYAVAINAIQLKKGMNPVTTISERGLVWSI